MKRAISIQVNPKLNALLQSVLERHHIELFVCFSMQEAQRAMLKESFCLVVVDTTMLQSEPAVRLSPICAQEPMLQS